MTATNDLERLVRASDLHGRRGSHVRPGHHRGWLVTLAVTAAVTAVTVLVA